MLAQGERIEYDAEEYVENPEGALYVRSLTPYVPPAQQKGWTLLTALPLADETWDGLFVVIRVAGQPDQMYVSLRNSDGSYGWAVLAVAPK